MYFPLYKMTRAYYLTRRRLYVFIGFINHLTKKKYSNYKKEMPPQFD